MMVSPIVYGPEKPDDPGCGIIRNGGSGNHVSEIRL
jgi:hypothetical protein